jgi:hypothetical protein
MKTAIEALKWSRDVAEKCEKRIAAKAKLPQNATREAAAKLGGMAGTAAAIKEIITKKLKAEVEEARRRLQSGGF